MKFDKVKILSRFAFADKYIEELKKFQNQITLNELKSNIGARSRIERAFEVVIQVIIDVCTHLVSNNFEVPQTYASCISILHDNDILNSNLSDNLIDAIKMRNVIAHQYADLDYQIIHSSIDQIITDFSMFKNIIKDIIKK